MEIHGLSDFQRDLVQVAQRELPREIPKVMRKIGSKARTQVARKARQLVKKQTGSYHKKFKRGKVFKDNTGQFVVRVINSAPHAHLIEYGHRQVTENGEVIGFVPGRKVMDKGMREFESSDVAGKEIEKWLDGLLRSRRL